ncbi:hypothetical protein C2G38_2056474 [Gigaspora rosea]|uniref:Uncharacterized protein n=1 Tax=Gigaspora rosea TaxID=44941 RepID=A0A397W5I9_9GLOM|nr:hypothetical protein C2G38_2056474 [Gigaspora rosea]
MYVHYTYHYFIINIIVFYFHLLALQLFFFNSFVRYLTSMISFSFPSSFLFFITIFIHVFNY